MATATTFLVIIAAACSGPRAAETSTDPADVAVKLGKVIRTTLRAYVSGFGSVEPEPATKMSPPASAKVASPVSGLLAESRAIEGARVQKGSVLFQLDSRVADVQVQKARQAVSFAEANFERQKHLLSVEATSKRLYQEAEQQLQVARDELANATAQRALLTVTAPLSGTVIRVNARPGDAVDPSTVLAEIVDLDRLVVTAKIRTGDVRFLQLGQNVELTSRRPESPESSGVPVETKAAISFIGSEVDPANDTVTVRAALPANSGLRPGQFVTLRVLYAEHRNSFAVPQDSVVTDSAGSSSWVAVVENNIASRRPVKTGIADHGLVEVQGDGLKEGEVIVATGSYGLPDHTRVRQAAQ